MKNVKMLLLIILCAGMPILTACGGSEPVAISELPTYPDAIALQAGESAIADTLATNVEQNKSVQEALGGIGGQIEQKGFQLPEGTSWEDVVQFYGEALEAQGWSAGIGGTGGMAVNVNEVMAVANEGSDVKSSIWSRDKQTLTMVMTPNPTTPDTNLLILSLSTQ